MSQTLKSPSLGRNPSSDYIKRRKSWSLLERNKDSLPDVRTFLGNQPYSEQSFKAKRERCGDVDWRRTLGFVLATIAVALLAGIIIAALAISFHSGIIYSQWLTAKDGTAYYINHIDRLQLLVLLATFFGAAVIVVAAYAVFCLVASISEGRRNKQRNIISLRDIRTGDLEQGDTHARTKQSIAKLMSDAERQYVAEYAQKAPSANGTHQMYASGASKVPQDHIKVQQLSEGSGNSVGLVQGRSWSLKRMWSGNSRQPEVQRGAAIPAFDRQQIMRDPNEMAAQLSSPDAFHRVTSSHNFSSRGDAGGSHRKAEEDSDPSLPATPSRADAVRQCLEAEVLPEGRTLSSTMPEPRIMVTIPVEQHGEGSAPSDSEEDFDKERQHSVLPHKAGDQPFRSKILTIDDDDSDFDDGETTTAWQDVHLESEDELLAPQVPGKEGHLLAGSPDQSRQASGEPKASIKFQSCSTSDYAETDEAVKGLLYVALEEVLPRPQAGLLNRLLRLARVEWLQVTGKGPVYIVQPGKEYMVGLKLSQKDPSRRRICAKWLRIQPPDGQAVRFNAEEVERKNNDWTGSACWDTSLHNSELMTPNSTSEADVIPIHVTVCLDNLEPPSYKVEARGILNIVLKDSPAVSRLRATESSGLDKSSSPGFYLL